MEEIYLNFINAKKETLIICLLFLFTSFYIMFIILQENSLKYENFFVRVCI